MYSCSVVCFVCEGLPCMLIMDFWDPDIGQELMLRREPENIQDNHW